MFYPIVLKTGTSISVNMSYVSKYFWLQELLMRMTLDSICKVGFGVEIGTLAPELPENRFAKAFDTANIIVTLRFIDPLWKMKKYLNIGSEALLGKSIKVVDDFTYSMIRRRKAEILEAQKSPSNNIKVTKKNVSTQINVYMHALVTY